MIWMGAARWTVLLTVLILSALGVVYTKYKARVLFTEIQRLERELDKYEVEWGQLQLELTTRAEHNRIERKARGSLGLVLPERDAIIYLKP
ncbi:MAG: cell division protein FtsL [Pseudomonadota bacterium]